MHAVAIASKSAKRLAAGVAFAPFEVYVGEYTKRTRFSHLEFGFADLDALPSIFYMGALSTDHQIRAKLQHWHWDGQLGI
ncbi:hypothetical protein A6R73_07100 [Xanthomonas translucens pv. poae]|uniref:Uncharacterized protein n=1 Tax=Xanthomonas graminis pv. poae TaxID=227946 RepID=A0A199NXU4_9XANT|nr:hypothetical protein A6R73_07100 [Xanthomonas translucens pv. poae]